MQKPSPQFFEQPQSFEQPQALDQELLDYEAALHSESSFPESEVAEYSGVAEASDSSDDFDELAYLESVLESSAYKSSDYETGSYGSEDNPYESENSSYESKNSSHKSENSSYESIDTEEEVASQAEIEAIFEAPTPTKSKKTASFSSLPVAEVSEFEDEPADATSVTQGRYQEKESSAESSHLNGTANSKGDVRTQHTNEQELDDRPIGGYAAEDEPQPGDYAYDDYRPESDYSNIPTASFVRESASKKPAEVDEQQRAPASAAPTIDYDEVTLTTKSSDQYDVLMTLETVTANCVLNVAITPDMFSGNKFTGARSEKIQAALKQGRKDVLNQLRASAYELGGNLVTDIDVKSGMKLLDKNNAKITVSASGEALSAELNSEVMA